MDGFTDKLMGWWATGLMDEGCGWMNDVWKSDGRIVKLWKDGWMDDSWMNG